MLLRNARRSSPGSGCGRSALPSNRWNSAGDAPCLSALDVVLVADSCAASWRREDTGSGTKAIGAAGNPGEATEGLASLMFISSVASLQIDRGDSTGVCRTLPLLKSIVARGGCGK